MIQSEDFLEKPEALQAALNSLSLSDWQYHPVVGSTNELALDWARDGAPDWSLVVADAQTTGRGRLDRRWVSRPGVSLAMSLVLRPSAQESAYVTRFTALGALGLVNALAQMGLPAEIKWPNDVLLQKKKVAGVLVEAEWQGDVLDALVVGLGVNIQPGAVPASDDVRFPSTSVEDAACGAVDRWALLADILQAMMAARSDLTSDAFLEAWNAHLAFRGDWVQFRLPAGFIQRLRVLGILPDGRLSMQGEDGQQKAFASGEVEMVYT